MNNVEQNLLWKMKVVLAKYTQKKSCAVIENYKQQLECFTSKMKVFCSTKCLRNSTCCRVFSVAKCETVEREIQEEIW